MTDKMQPDARANHRAPDNLTHAGKNDGELSDEALEKATGG